MNTTTLTSSFSKLDTQSWSYFRKMLLHEFNGSMGLAYANYELAKSCHPHSNTDYDLSKSQLYLEQLHKLFNQTIDYFDQLINHYPEIEFSVIRSFVMEVCSKKRASKDISIDWHIEDEAQQMAYPFVWIFFNAAVILSLLVQLSKNSKISIHIHEPQDENMFWNIEFYCTGTDNAVLPSSAPYIRFLEQFFGLVDGSFSLSEQTDKHLIYSLNFSLPD